MNDDRASRPAASGAAAVARVWAGALGRLLLFGILFIVLEQLLAFALAMAFATWEWRGALAIAEGGFIWLGAALLASVIVLRWLDHRSWRALGLAPAGASLRVSALGMALGVAMMALAVALMLATADLVFMRQAGSTGAMIVSMLASLATLALPAAAEEAVFRGYPIQVIARAAGAPMAVLTTSAAFAAVHSDNPAIGPLALTNIFLAGVLLGAVYFRTGSLWAAIAVHLGWNWAMAGLFDLPVSGLGWIDVPRFEPIVSGPAWWNGGAFGPEGGVIGTIVFVVATVLVLRSRRFGRADVAPENRLLCDRFAD